MPGRSAARRRCVSPLVVLCLPLLAACSMVPMGEGSLDLESRAGFTAGRAQEDATKATDTRTEAETRLMVYQAALGLEVASVEDTVAAAVAKAQELGGYLAKRHGGDVTLRVPAAKFEAFLAAARELGRVLHESIEASDVTREHQDLAIRLDNAKKSRDRLLALLAKAEKVEDVLAIERELRRLTEEIERMEGELRYLDNRIALATVTLRLQSLGAGGPRPAAKSRFSWINEVGAEQVRHGF